MAEDINIFKINLFSYDVEDNNNHHKYEYKKYCIDSKILGWGWCRGNDAKQVNSLDEYHKDYGKSRSLSVACNQIAPMKDGDYVWTYVDRQWYLGKISGDFNFFAPNEYPAFGMQRKCDWKKVNKDLVPGNIITHSRNDGTVRRISSNDSFVKYCQYLYKDLEEEPQNLNFWDLAHYEDLEDIVGLYLQKERGYLIFPSTNKTGTEDYEYMLVQKDSPNKKAIIQCKNNSCISEYNWEKFEIGEYKEYQTYILTIKEDQHPKRAGYKQEIGIYKWSFDNGRILIFNEEKLKEWAKVNFNILPERVKKYIEISE